MTDRHHNHSARYIATHLMKIFRWLELTKNCIIISSLFTTTTPNEFSIFTTTKPNEFFNSVDCFLKQSVTTSVLFLVLSVSRLSTWYVFLFDRMGMILPTFKMAKYALKEIIYQRSFVSKSKNRCENLARFRIRDWRCWHLHSKFLNMSRDFCKQHFFDQVSYDLRSYERNLSNCV